MCSGSLILRGFKGTLMILVLLKSLVGVVMAFKCFHGSSVCFTTVLKGSSACYGGFQVFFMSRVCILPLF